MKQTVYIETTIPSFYYEDRLDPQAIARKEWTIDWWDNFSKHYNLVTSAAVIDELNGISQEKKNKCLEKVINLPFLAITEEILNIVDYYIFHKIMPDDNLGDALHLALASFYKCDYLLTWNCKHLANANKFKHIQIINSVLGIFVPTLTTPFQLIEEFQND
jgi:predicted nucleic acid-binding protein